MSNDLFEVRFLSTEQDFIYNFGVNKGHSLSYSKVNRCLFLSAAAKQLYHNICDYAWGDKRDCHPSQSVLRLELGWSRTSMDKYLKELRDAGLIRCESQGVNKPLMYYISELRTLPIIVHSEVIHQARVDLSGFSNTEGFYTALSAYRDSAAATGFSLDGDLQEQSERITEWFRAYFRSEPAQAEQPVAVERTQASIAKPKLPVPPPALDGLQKSATLDTAVRKGKAAFDPSDASTWTMQAFRHHFEDLYALKYQKAGETLEKDVAQLSRLLRTHKENKQLVKDYMKAYFELDFFTPKTLARFCSNFTQSVLDEYMRTGKLPRERQKQAGSSAIPDEQEQVDMTAEDTAQLEALRKKGFA